MTLYFVWQGNRTNPRLASLFEHGSGHYRGVPIFTPNEKVLGSGFWYKHKL